mmetsp:Transcript_4036/g.9632  ORF Transcript_4036/g.9632 Transcript_4036/m.9632 type:complete len:292 (-) Transcript_4036:1616-2491(-)
MLHSKQRVLLHQEHPILRRNQRVVEELELPLRRAQHRRCAPLQPLLGLHDKPRTDAHALQEDLNRRLRTANDLELQGQLELAQPLRHERDSNHSLSIGWDQTLDLVHAERRHAVREFILRQQFELGGEVTVIDELHHLSIRVPQEHLPKVHQLLCSRDLGHHALALNGDREQLVADSVNIHHKLHVVLANAQWDEVHLDLLLALCRNDTVRRNDVELSLQHRAITGNLEVTPERDLAGIVNAKVPRRQKPNGNSVKSKLVDVNLEAGPHNAPSDGEHQRPWCALECPMELL